MMRKKVKNIKNPVPLDKQFAEIDILIRQARINAYAEVNSILVVLYWKVGGYIHGKLASAEWGDSIVEKLAEYIHRKNPNLKGFTRANLFRMRQFYETYCTNKKVAPVVRQIHPAAMEVFKDSYVLEFIGLRNEHAEIDLHQGLILKLKDFLTELGRDFCFVGSEFPLQVGRKDFALDLLFFHRGLNCLVAIELKVDEFKPEYLGKLEFYLEALDRNIRKSHEKPAIGVLLCASKDNEVVEFALSRSSSPTLIAEYETKLPEKKLLREKLHEFYERSTELLSISPKTKK